MADEFTLQVSEFAKQFIDGSEKAVRGTVIKLGAAFVDSSPVDTGRFRANWFLTGSEPSVKVTTKTDKSGDTTKKGFEVKAMSLKDWSVFTYTNNLPYGPVIEFGRYGNGPKTVGGFSKQAPRGVVRQNIMRFNKLLAEEAARYLPK